MNKMTKEEIKQIINEKAKNGVFVRSVYGNTDINSDLGYSWRYRIDYKEDEEYGGEDWYLVCDHCGNGRGCFSVTDEYMYIYKDDAYKALLKKAYVGDCPLGTITIEFSDGTEVDTRI